MSRLKIYNDDPEILKIKALYSRKLFNLGFENDRFHPFTPELNLRNYPNYKKEHTIMVCKLEDIRFLLLQEHPKENIIYLADNDYRKAIAESQDMYGVKAYEYDGKTSSNQKLKRIMKDFRDTIPIVIFRNRAFHKKGFVDWDTYRKLAKWVCTPNGFASVTGSPMALSTETVANDHDVFAFAFGRMEKNSAPGGYVSVIYNKGSKLGNKPKILSPIDPANKYAHSIMEKVLGPNSFIWHHQNGSMRTYIKKNQVKMHGNQSVIINFTGNLSQPFIYGDVKDPKLLKKIQPKGLYVLAKKQHTVNPADCVATTQPNFCNISYTTTHPSWKIFPHAQLMSRHFLDNKIRTFFCETLGLKHRTYFCFWKAFDVNEIKVSTDYPASYGLSPMEKQFLDTL